MAGLGKVFLVGGGPGDPELITAKGLRRLARADLVLYDALIHADLLEHCRPDARLEFVGKRGGRKSQRQADINERLVRAAREGDLVVRLKGGDPYLFGRGSEEAEYLSAHGIPFEVIPGVPSPLAATAYAGISLTHRELASSITYLTATESPEKDATAHDWGKLATATQTLVIFMGRRRLASLMELLVEHGRRKDCPVAVIESASLPRQRTVVGTVADIAQRVERAGLGTPALTVVGEVVKLRQVLRWYDCKPLFGRRVLVTRAAQQSRSLSAALRDAGAQPVAVPVLRIDPPADVAPLQTAVGNLSDYDWVVFTSANGVERFFAELARQDADARRLGNSRIAAIGPGTADALRPHGLRADVVPDEYRGEALAQAIKAHHDDHMNCVSVLIPRAEQAREVLPDMLREAGARVDVVPSYRTLPPLPPERAQLRSLIEAGDVDTVTFTSSSSVQHTLEALGDDAVELLEPLTLASVGPITTATAEQHGLRVDVTAEQYTIDGLVAALEQHAVETD